MMRTLLRGPCLGFLVRSVGGEIEAIPNGVSQDVSEPLLDFLENSVSLTGATKVLKLAMLLSGLGGVIVGLPCCGFLAMHWDGAGAYDRPLRWWLLVHSALQLAQAPARLTCFAKINSAGTDARAQLRAVKRSLAWLACKHASTLSAGWFLVGLVWVLNVESCPPECPGLYWICVVVIIATILTVSITGTSIYHTLMQPPVKPTGATKEVISALASFVFSDVTSGLCDCTCSICLSDFAAGDLLRRLPCKHCQFHTVCIDAWLLRNKRCPLCMVDVDHVSYRETKKYL